MTEMKEVWVNIALLDVDGKREFCLLGAYKKKSKAERDSKIAESYGGYPVVLTIKQNVI